MGDISWAGNIASRTEAHLQNLWFPNWKMAVISRLVLIKLLLVLLLVVGALGSSYSAQSPRTSRSALTQAPSPSPSTSFS